MFYKMATYCIFYHILQNHSTIYIKGNAKSTLQKTHLILICLFLYLFDQIIALLHLLTSRNMVFGKCSLTFLKDDYSVSA